MEATATRRLCCAHLWLVAFLFATPASATQTLSCSAAQRDLAFDLMASVGHENTLSNPRASLNARSLALTLDLAQGRMRDVWIGRNLIRLRLLWIRRHGVPLADFGVVARRVSDSDFVGRFRLKVADRGRSVARSGAVACQLGY